MSGIAGVNQIIASCNAAAHSISWDDLSAIRGNYDPVGLYVNQQISSLSALEISHNNPLWKPVVKVIDIWGGNAKQLCRLTGDQVFYDSEYVANEIRNKSDSDYHFVVCGSQQNGLEGVMVWGNECDHWTDWQNHLVLYDLMKNPANLSRPSISSFSRVSRVGKTCVEYLKQCCKKISSINFYAITLMSLYNAIPFYESQGFSEWQELNRMNGGSSVTMNGCFMIQKRKNFDPDAPVVNDDNRIQSFQIVDTGPVHGHDEW